MTHLPWPSITRAPRGTFVVAAGPTALMRLPAMITVLSDELAAAPSSSGCTTVAPTMAVRAPSAGLAARGAASDTAAAAPQSAAASTIVACDLHVIQHPPRSRPVCVSRLSTSIQLESGSARFQLLLRIQR